MKLKEYSFKTVKSTNDVALKIIKKGNMKGIVISEKQIKGKGQHGKKWISQKGNLFISIFFQIKKNTSIKKITKDNCLIIKKLLSKFVNKKIIIKQPNDLLINKEKICGILQETLIYNDKKFLVLGIGINLVNSPNINNYPTTYLSKHTENKINKLFVFDKIKELYEKKLNNL